VSDVLRSDPETFATPDDVFMLERLVIAPCTGRFLPLPPEVFATEGEWVEPGTPLAEIESGGTRTPVLSEFRGWVMGPLAVPGQPVAEHDALFWIRCR
jgi:biotin carboxyl carrier protein